MGGLMLQILVVGVGGFLGSVARYGVSALANRWVGGGFPAGTLAVNVAGCYLIGLLWAWLEARQLLATNLGFFLTVGILGGFTTFSAFGNETLDLLRRDRAGLAGLNVLANVLLGVGAVWLGRLSMGTPHAT